jgi:hypothetical protein
MVADSCDWMTAACIPQLWNCWRQLWHGGYGLCVVLDFKIFVIYFLGFL